MTHIFRNSLSGDVLASYQGSHTETIEAMAEAAGVNLAFYDIVECGEDETSLVRKNPLSLLENKHPLSTNRSPNRPVDCPPALYPPPGWRRFYKEFTAFVKLTALHKFLPHTQSVENDASIKACAAVLQWQAFEIRMDYIEDELIKGIKFERFELDDNGHPNEPIKCRSYAGCLLSVCHSLCISEEEGLSFIGAVVKVAEDFGIVDAIKVMVDNDGIYTYFA